MTDYTTDAEKRATRGYALVAFFIIAMTILAIVVLSTLHITGLIAPGASVYLALLFGGIAAVFVTALLASRKTRGRATNITDHRPYSATTNIYSTEESE